MQRRASRLGRASAPGGFTLIELLMVMVVIAILASVAMAGLFAAQEAAKEAKTKSTITKLHNQLMLRWETYRTRRLPVAMNPNNKSRTLFAKRKLRAMWKLMRMEMPDVYADLSLPWSEIDPRFNALSIAYNEFLEPTATPENASAECLYLIITVGMNDGEEVRFLASEIGDTDEDGMSEFLDGWGRPIRWLRWAPGYVPRLSADTDFQVDDPRKQADPFDSLGVGRPGGGLEPFGPPPTYGFKLVPLIYSAGPDGEFGILSPFEPDRAWNPYSLHPDPVLGDVWRGAPTSNPFHVPEGGGHMDNITNHRLGER